MLKILADENVDLRVIKALRKQGYDVMHISAQYGGMDDLHILLKAAEESAVLLTNDRDIGEWIHAFNVKTRGVLYLRYKSSDLDVIIDRLLNILSEYGELLYNKYISITPKKIRIKDI